MIIRLKAEANLLAVRLSSVRLNNFPPPKKAKKGLLRVAYVVGNPLLFCERYTTIKDQHQINEMIRDREVRVISATGEQLGIMSASEALRLAEEESLDLVKISPNAVPPVCKIMNYGKFKFEQAKKTLELLEDGNKVKVSIRMRGRQMAHASMGVDVMNRFFELMNGKAVMDKQPKTEGRNIFMILSPAK